MIMMLWTHPAVVHFLKLGLGDPGETEKGFKFVIFLFIARHAINCDQTYFPTAPGFNTNAVTVLVSPAVKNMRYR
jgi:hypothetical protein